MCGVYIINYRNIMDKILAVYACENINDIDIKLYKLYNNYYSRSYAKKLLAIQLLTLTESYVMSPY